MEQALSDALHWITRGIEVVGILVIVTGTVAATFAYLNQLAASKGSETAFRHFRSSLGRSILLGLEFLVAADIISTVAIDPTLEGVAVLAGIVVIRTFLSFALEVELEGDWPWRRRRNERRDASP